MGSHDQKSHVATHFDNLDLRNAIMLLMMLSTSHNTDTSAMASHDTITNSNASCDVNVDISGIT